MLRITRPSSRTLPSLVKKSFTGISFILRTTACASSVPASFYGFQVMQGGSIRASICHRGDLFTPFHEALRPRPRFLCEIPVEGGGKNKALSTLQTYPMDIRNVCQQANHFLPVANNSELVRLLD